MAQQATADGGRTETKRFETDVDVDDLIEGDRIDRTLVAPHLDMVGDPLRRTLPNVEDDPDAQLAVATPTSRISDVHHALLLDPESGTYVRASRTDRQQAMSQREADWTVHGVGSEIVVEAVDDVERPEGEREDDAEAYVQDWIDIVFGDLAAGYDDYEDERRLTSSATLEVEDFDGRKAVATISLAEEDE